MSGRKRMNDRYVKLAEEHANFLCEKVFKPAFIMAFIHGAKHMAQEMENKANERVYRNVHRKKSIST